MKNLPLKLIWIIISIFLSQKLYSQSIQATNIKFQNPEATQVDISWTNGDGVYHLVVVRAGSAVDADPMNGVTYTSDPNYGDGGQVGSGNYVIYKGVGNSVTFSSMNISTSYHVRVYEYNGGAGSENYLTTTATDNPNTSLTGAVTTGDYNTLVTFYNSTGGGSWTDNTNWLSGDVSTWNGITVSANRVSEIRLASNNLVGALPTEIGVLDGMTVLRIESNQIAGALPNELSDLSSLDYFSIQDNLFSGSIPSALSEITSLTHLALDGNQFDGPIPTELGLLTNLDFMDLDRNQLTGSIPISFGNLVNLTQLRFDENLLSGTLPSDLGSLTMLTHFEFNDNSLTGAIPTSYTNLVNLQYFDMDRNDLEDLPDCSVMTSLVSFDIDDNAFEFDDIEPNIGLGGFNYIPQAQVTGPESLSFAVGEDMDVTIPVGGANNVYQWVKNGGDMAGENSDNLVINTLSLLDAGTYYLRITNTVVTGLTLTSESFTVSVTDYGGITESDYLALMAFYTDTDGDNWTNNSNWFEGGDVNTWNGVSVSGLRVTAINLNDNLLNGTIPIEIGELTELTTLDIHNNLLIGSIPIQIGNLINLTELRLDGNDISGSIPAEIGNLINLDFIDFDNNQLSGAIPPEIGNLVLLTGMEMTDNQLAGDIPIEIGGLSSLQWLDVHNNLLSGSIPTQIGDLINLTSLRFDGNELTGPIPAEIGNLINLDFIDFDNNQLSGAIPPEIGNLIVLTGLEMRNNQLSGSIPVEIGNLVILDVLDLNHNPITGVIPSEIGSLSQLTYLNLNNCDLSGSIPSEIGDLSLLEDLVLNNNSLSGTIPPELGNLGNVTYFDLHNNDLTGSIPPNLGNLSSVTWIQLYGNELTGTIPTEIGTLTGLTTLQLHQNLLTGDVPTSFQNLTLLEDLRVRSNQLDNLPDLSVLTNLTNFQIHSNNFHFDDIEPNVNINGVDYDPQNQIAGPGDLEIDVGNTLDISISVGGSQNIYQWLKDGIAISGENSDRLVINNIDATNTGVYQLQVTSSLVTGLTLMSEEFGLNCSTVMWYADVDNDGFGDPEASLTACDQPDGFISDNTDCNDADATINPDADDPYPHFGVDRNCDGFILEVRGNSETNDMLVFPNPTNSILNLDINANHLFIDEVRIFSLTGELMNIINFEQDIKIVEIDVSILSRGVYVLEVSQSDFRPTFIRFTKE